MADSIIIYILVSTTLVLSGTLILVLGNLFDALKKNRSYQKDIERIQKDILNHSQNILDKAREKAQGIIIAANEGAREILAQSKKLETETMQSSNELSSQLLNQQKQELEKVSGEFFEKYKNVLGDLYNNNINMFRNISKGIEESATSEVRDFKQILEKETVESQKIVGEKIEGRYQEVQKEIDDLRNEELAKLKDQIYEITKKSVELALGRSLDLQTQEAILMESLKEAIESSELRDLAQD